MKLNLILGAVLAALMTITATPEASAGPGIVQHFFPVNTVDEAASIKPGTHIAMICGKCGEVTTMIADKDQSYLHGYVCEHCKQKFTVHQDPHGGLHGEYICDDGAGHRATLLQAE